MPTGAGRGCLIPGAEVTGGRELPNLGARTHANLLQQQTPLLSHHILGGDPWSVCVHTALHGAFISSHCPRPLLPCVTHSFVTFIASLSLHTLANVLVLQSSQLSLECRCYKVASYPLRSLTCLKPPSDCIAQQILPFP